MALTSSPLHVIKSRKRKESCSQHCHFVYKTLPEFVKHSRKELSIERKREGQGYKHLRTELEVLEFSHSAEKSTLQEDDAPNCKTASQIFQRLGPKMAPRPWIVSPTDCKTNDGLSFQTCNRSDLGYIGYSSQLEKLASLSTIPKLSGKAREGAKH